MADSINYWTLLPEVWLILAILLIVSEVVIDAAYFLLALGIASLIMSATIFLQEAELVSELLADWMDAFILYAVLSIIAVLIMKGIVRDSDGNEDINKY